MASNTNLSISDLADVLAAIKEVTKPYQLGIQLKIDSSELKTIERNYSKDIDRQKTEVIEHWLRNSPDASWTTLANAVERMRGHAKLAGILRRKEQSIVGDTAKLQEEQIIRENPVSPTQQVLLSRQTSYVRPIMKLSGSETLSLDVCVYPVIFSFLVRWVMESQHWEIEC
jgi:hypothetical protein